MTCQYVICYNHIINNTGTKGIHKIMALSFYYISDGKAHLYKDDKETELSWYVLNSYIEKVKSSAKRNEWKHSGSGAAFTGTYEAGADAESRVSSIFSRVNCMSEYNGELLYSMTIDNTTGIYRKAKDDNSADGIIISDADNAYLDFDVKDGRIVLSSAFAGESHIGVMYVGDSYCRIYTEGRSWDSSPVWSASDPDKIYFCCAGLPINDNPEPRNEKPKSYGEIINEIYSAAASSVRGPSSVCVFDLIDGSIDEVLSNDRYDYVHPQSTSDGSLYYIRKPYESGVARSNPLGCLADVVLFPVRILGALFGFLNVFSAKYSGKTLSRNTDVKKRNEAEVFIDGNLINAEKELKANRDRGDKNPGIIPRSWELHRLSADGRDTIIRTGVAAFKVCEDDGSILVSNGSHILRLTSDGKEEKILSAPKVSFIR